MNLLAAEDAIQQGSVLVAEERQGNRAGLKDTNGRDKEAAARRALLLMMGNFYCWQLQKQFLYGGRSLIGVSRKSSFYGLRMMHYNKPSSTKYESIL